MIKKNLNEIDIQIGEKWRHKEFLSYELDLFLARRKILYEELHPEAKHGSYMKQRRESGQKKLPKKTIVAESATIVPPDIPTKNGNVHTKPFSKIFSKIIGISERAIRDHIRIGQSIIDKKFDDETVQLYKEGLISHSKMLRIARENDKSQLNSEKLVDNTNEELKYCKNCSRAKASTCPCCGKRVIICDKGYITLKKPNSESCTDYKP